MARIHIGAGDGESVKTGRCSISVPPSEVDSVPDLAVARAASGNDDLITVSKKKWVLEPGPTSSRAILVMNGVVQQHASIHVTFM